MLICLYKGDGEIKDRDGNNVHPISMSLEFLPQLRTWHGGSASPGYAVPIIPGVELPSNQYQFVIRESSVKIPAINYQYYGEKGYIFGTKPMNRPLRFEEWSISKFISSPSQSEGLYSADPPSFLYRDLQPWDCYTSMEPDCPEYGQLAPVIDFSSNNVIFKADAPLAYVKGAKLEIKLILQTFYESV